MSYIFLGFFFVAFDFNITLGNAVIGLIPDFIGYFLILIGIIELQDLAVSFRNINHWVLLMVFLNVITYMMDLLGISAKIHTGVIILSIVLLVLNLYIQYFIIRGIQEMEKSQCVDLSAEKLFLLWKIIAVFSVFSYIALVLPWLVTVFVIILAITNIMFLYYLYQSKKAYEQNG